MAAILDFSNMAARGESELVCLSDFWTFGSQISDLRLLDESEPFFKPPLLLDIDHVLEN